MERNETKEKDFRFDKIFAKFMGDHDLTMAQISHDTGISYTTINSWQKGKATPKFDQIVKLCKTYKVSPEYFCGMATKEEFKNIEYISKYTGLSIKAIENLHHGFEIKDKNIVESFLNDEELVPKESIYTGIDILISNFDNFINLEDSLNCYFWVKNSDPNAINNFTTRDNETKKITRRFKGKNSWLASIFLTDIMSIIQNTLNNENK